MVRDYCREQLTQNDPALEKALISFSQGEVTWQRRVVAGIETAVLAVTKMGPLYAAIDSANQAVLLNYAGLERLAAVDEELSILNDQRVSEQHGGIDVVRYGVGMGLVIVPPINPVRDLTRLLYTGEPRVGFVAHAQLQDIQQRVCPDGKLYAAIMRSGEKFDGRLKLTRKGSVVRNLALNSDAPIEVKVKQVIVEGNNRTELTNHLERFLRCEIRTMDEVQVALEKLVKIQLGGETTDPPEYVLLITALGHYLLSGYGAQSEVEVAHLIGRNGGSSHSFDCALTRLGSNPVKCISKSLELFKARERALDKGRKAARYALVDCIMQ